MGKYLNPKADLTFKKIFGEHKHLVISLLNALLPLKDDERVESIEYWPAEKIPERTEVEKFSIVDVCCKDNKNREFIVEMQMSWAEAFKKRVLLNASKAYVAQSTKGMVYENLQPVYALNFVNEEFQKDVDDYYHYYHFVHDKYTDKVIDGLHLIFVELPKFKPTTFSERKMQVLWLRFLTEIDENTSEVPAELLANAEVSEALEIVERAAFTDEEMRSYDKFWDQVSAYRTWESDWKKKVKRAEDMLTEAKAKATEAKAKATEAEAKVSELETKATEAEAKVSELETKATEAEAKVSELETKATEAEAKVSELETKATEDKLESARKLKGMGLLSTKQIAEIIGLTQEQINQL